MREKFTIVVRGPGYMMPDDFDEIMQYFPGVKKAILNYARAEIQARLSENFDVDEEVEDV